MMLIDQIELGLSEHESFMQKLGYSRSLALEQAKEGVAKVEAVLKMLESIDSSLYAADMDGNDFVIKDIKKQAEKALRFFK